METLNGLKRTHYCGDLRESNINEEVVLMGWVQKKRNLGGLVFVDLRDRSVKAQFKYSDKINAKFTIVIGDDELANDTATLKNMSTSEQTTIKLSEIVQELKSRM